MSKKKALVLFAMMLLALALSACGNSKEEKEKAKIREVTQKYFDALRVGDQEGVYDCYLPIEREKHDAELGLLGLASKLILKVDITEVLSGLNLLFGGKNDFANYKYRASEVDLGEDGEEAIAYVGMYQEKEWLGNLRVEMTRYDGNWYVVKNTVAYDERTPEEGISEGGTGETQGVTAGRIWLFLGIAIFAVAVMVALFLFLRSRGGRRRAAGNAFTDFGVPGGGMASGDIMCGCGAVNPAGIRTCLGCGKKLKKRR